jgi:hypothetical protein
METLNVNYYGLPISENYSVGMDLALLRTEYTSAWRRQRRTFLHNASLITLTWRLDITRAQSLMAWLQAQPGGSFFICDLLTGNDTDASCVISPTNIRRTSAVGTRRIPLTNMFLVSFEAETQFQANYSQLASAAADQPPTTYPSGFPWPMATTFSSEHGERNVTVYSLSYTMNTEMLADWLAFAGFAGTAWFWHPMVSTNVPCGQELIRYISEPAQSLIGPNTWTVSITAESKPASIILDDFLPPPGPGCYYNGESSYDDATELYDCSGVVPPQGNFTMPTGTVFINNTVTGPSPLTVASLLKINSNGSVVSEPQSNPVWTSWHTDPGSLVAPAIKFNSIVEFSRDDGVSWIYYTPGADGPWINLKTQNVWIRLSKTSTYDISETISVVATFDDDAVATQYGVQANATIELAVVLDVTDPTGVVDGAVFNDGYNYTFDPGDTVESVSAGVTFMSDGRVYGQSTNQLLGLWYDPQQINAGQGLWIILAGVGTGTGPAAGKSFPPTGVRLSLAVQNSFTAIAQAIGGGSAANVSWLGTYQVYNAQSGGTLLGSGSINLESEVSQ